jgi:hypothetical protein
VQQIKSCRRQLHRPNKLTLARPPCEAGCSRRWFRQSGIIGSLGHSPRWGAHGALVCSTAAAVGGCYINHFLSLHHAPGLLLGLAQYRDGLSDLARRNYRLDVEADIGHEKRIKNFGLLYALSAGWTLYSQEHWECVPENQLPKDAPGNR